MELCITSCYRFTPLKLENLPILSQRLEDFAAHSGLRGLCLLGTEGINLTVSGATSVIAEFKGLLGEVLELNDLQFKDSTASKQPFLIFKVKVKDEIVTLGRPDLAPTSPVNSHLSPAEWHQAVQDPEAVVIDTRNDYEVDIGKFKTAIDFRTKEFREFPEAVRNSGIAKDKKVLMYCTGGIRCEKAILAMQEQGYKNVFQLDGGILNYLKDFPRAEFEGECFVFDYRVSVDQDLAPTQKYLLCPHCGQPANIKIECGQCTTAATICPSCYKDGTLTCSKNCAHHMSIGSASAKPHSQELAKRRKKSSSPA
ncbi:MAG: hypothetical protein KF799_05910 [Bdellovibrionales bacterium]|nr:hypothetical protein [Bdellovibrionales bacterium]